MSSIVAISPRHQIIGDAVIHVVLHITNASILPQIAVKAWNQTTNPLGPGQNAASVYSYAAKRLEQSQLTNVPANTWQFAVDVDPKQFSPGGDIYVVAGDLPTGTPPALPSQYFQVAQAFTSSIPSCGPIEGNTTLDIGLSHKFTELDGTTSTGIQVRFADTHIVPATQIEAASPNNGPASTLLRLLTPNLVGVCEELYSTSPASPRTVAQGSLPLTVEFPDGSISNIPGYTFNPVEFVRVEPPAIDIRGSSPIAGLFSPNASTASIQATIGQQISSHSQWGLPNVSTAAVREVVIGDQMMLAVQATYTVPEVSEIETSRSTDPSTAAYEFPVAITFQSTPTLTYSIPSFSITPLPTPLLVPADNTSFELVLKGTDLISSVHSLILYTFPKADGVPRSHIIPNSGPKKISILDVLYADATQYRIQGPISSRFTASASSSVSTQAWSPFADAGVALSGCIMSPFFLDYFASVPVYPAETTALRTYAFTSCTPSILPRQMREITDAVQITISGIGFGDATVAPKVLLKTADGLISIELDGKYARPSPTSSEQIINAWYRGSPSPEISDSLEVYAQIDGSNWVKVRNARIALYDIAGDSISPLNGNYWDPVFVKILGLKEAMVVKGTVVDVNVTFCDDDSESPGSIRWNALTKKALLGKGGDPDVVVVVNPPRVQFPKPSFKLQISVDGQPPISTPDLCNMMFEESSNPAWCEPQIIPENGEVRIIGSNFVDIYSTKALTTTIVPVIPGDTASLIWTPPATAVGTVAATHSPAVALANPLKISHISDGELLISDVPALPQGLYDFQIGREGEILSPCQALYNVYAWGAQQHTIAFGTGQRPMIKLPFLAAQLGLPSKPASNASTSSFGRVRIGKGSTLLKYDDTGSHLAFQAPTISRGSSDLGLSYSPDNHRFVVIPNVNVTVIDIDRLEPPQAAVGVKTRFKLYGGPFPSVQAAALDLQFATLLPAASGAGVQAVPNGKSVRVTDIQSDHITFDATLDASGAIILFLTTSEPFADGISTKFIWPAQYSAVLDTGVIPFSAAPDDKAWPRILSAYGIHAFEPLFARSIGNTVLSIQLQDPALTVPWFLQPVVKLDRVEIRFQAENVYSTSVEALPHVDSSATRRSPRADGSSLAKSLVQFRPDPSKARYKKTGWTSVPASPVNDNDIDGVIRVRTPRVEKPGTYSISLSINGSSDYAPVIGGQRMFLYDTGNVSANNQVYAVAGPSSGVKTPVVMYGQFLPPFSAPEYAAFRAALTLGARLKVGPLDATGSEKEPIVLANPSVTSNTLTFALSPEEIPETNRLYLQLSESEPFQDVGALLSLVSFSSPKPAVCSVRYQQPIYVTGSEFPFGRERTLSARLWAASFQVVCTGAIISSDTLTFSLPNDTLSGDNYRVSIQFGEDASTPWLDTGLSLTLYQPTEYEPRVLMGNTEAWALEAADNYISVWGWAFTTDCDLNLQLCAPTGAVVFQSPCSYVSQNELRAEIGQLPPSGSFEVRLAPSQGDVLPSNTWSFGDDLHLAVVQLKSFFPLFGQANPIEPETLSITTDASSLNSLQPLCRWKARVTPYDLKQDVVSLNGEHLLCTVPKVTLDPKFPIASDSFDVLCSVDSHSIRQYGPPDSNSYTMVKQPIWRLVDTLHQFRFVDVQSISPSFCGTSGGEPITITFSADIRSSTATGQSLAVFFGDQPGYDAAWVSGNSISVNTPILSANPGLTLKVMVDQEPFTFVGFSVYELTSVSPSYGIQGSQALHAFGKYLPPGRKGKIFLSAQTRAAPVANPVPSLPAIQASVLSAIAAAQAADRAVADNAVHISATTKAFQEAQLRLGRAQAQKSQVDAASQDPLIAKTLATLQSQVVAELTAAQAESFSVSRTLTDLQRNQVSLIATAKAAHDTLTKAEASQETTDSQTAAASNAATISQSHIVLPSFLQTTSTVSTIPTPTVADFWFYLPRGISPTESYDIWYCPDGNTVPTLLPNAFRPFVITSIGPLAASITANQTITINGVFPAELQSQVLNVRFLNDTDQSVYVDCPATWTSPSVLSVVLKANSFAQVCDLVIQVSVQGDRSAHYVLDSGTTTRSLISLYRLSSLINTLIPTFGGESFIVIDNLTDRLAGFKPSVKIGSIQVAGTIRSTGSNQSNVPGLIFPCPAQPVGEYPIQVTFDENAITWDRVENDCDTLYYYEPLPGTEAQAVGISFTQNAPSWMKPFVFKQDPKNSDQLLPAMCQSKIGGVVADLNLFSTTTPLQLLNLSGSSTLCNGDPVGLRVLVSGGWRCLRLKRYPPAFSLDVPPIPDAVIVDDSDASAEYPDCREALFGIWRVMADQNGNPYVDPSPNSEIRLGSDRVLIVGQCFMHDIDPALVEINHELKDNNGAGGSASTAPILDLDLNTPTGVGNDFLTSPRPSNVPSGIMISKSFQVAIIDGFIQFAQTPSAPYNEVPDTADILSAKSTSSLVVDAFTMYLFATDLVGSKQNNIYWSVLNNGKASPWAPLFNPAVKRMTLDTKSNVRAVALSANQIMLFQQTQATGLLRAFVVSRNTDTNALDVQDTVKLSGGFNQLPDAAGAPVFLGKFTVLFDKANNLWNFLTVPACDSSSVVHVRYKALTQSPFIDTQSGELVSRYGFLTPLVQGTDTHFYGLQGGDLKVTASSWYGNTPVSIYVRATSGSTIEIQRYCGSPITISLSGGVQTFTIPAVNTPDSGIDDALEADLSVPLSLKMAGGSFKPGDSWMFQIMPPTVGSLQPSASGLAQASLTGVFSGPTAMRLTLKVGAVSSSMNQGVRTVSGSITSSWSDKDAASTSAAKLTNTTPFSVDKSSTSIAIPGYGLSLILPAVPQTDGALSEDGVPIPDLHEGDTWVVDCTSCYPAVECISQPPAACLTDDSGHTAFVALATYNGSGTMIFLKVDLSSGNLLDYRVSPLRTGCDFQVHTIGAVSTLVFRGLISSNVTWANGVLGDLGSSEDAKQSNMFPKLGNKYRLAHLGLLHSLRMTDTDLGFSGNQTIPTTQLISTDYIPPPIHSRCIYLVPPAYITTGCVDVLGAGYVTGASLMNGSPLFEVLSLCSTSSKRVPSSIFAPAFIYNVDRDTLLNVQKNVQSELKADYDAQNQGDNGNPFADGSSLWNVRPLMSDADYGNDYHQWELVFKWLYQLSLCSSLVAQGSTWPDSIAHKVFFITVSHSYRAAGPDFWALRIGMDRQKKLTDIAMNLRAFKYRYSVHLASEISLAFPDLADFSRFGGICNVTGVSLCHPNTMDQLGKVAQGDLDGILGDLITELRYLDSTIYGQVLSHLNNWAVLGNAASLGVTSPSSSSNAPDDGSDDRSPPRSDSQSAASKIAQDLGPIGVFAAGAMLVYSVYGKKSVTKNAAGKAAEINAEKGAKDGVREYNRSSEGPRSWAADGSVPRTMPPADGTELDVADSFKVDDMVARDGADFMRKVDDNPELLDGSPELKEQVSAIKDEGAAHGRVGAVMEGAFTALAVLGMVGNWDQMGLADKILDITGVACIGVKILGTIIGSKFPALVKGATAGLEEFGEKIGAELGEKFLSGATGRFLSAAGECIALEGLKILGPLGNIAFAVEGIISAVDDFKNGKVLDGALELASSLAMLGAAMCDLLVLAGATAAEGVGEVLMAVVVIIMLVDMFIDPKGFATMMEELGSDLFGTESPEDEAIDDMIEQLKYWALSTTLSSLVNFDVSPHDDDPRIIKRND